jgi:hypothetical protein
MKNDKSKELFFIWYLVLPKEYKLIATYIRLEEKNNNFLNEH